jgi:hypothetical protein
MIYKHELLSSSGKSDPHNISVIPSDARRFAKRTLSQIEEPVPELSNRRLTAEAASE